MTKSARPGAGIPTFDQGDPQATGKHQKNKSKSNLSKLRVFSSRTIDKCKQSISFIQYIEQVTDRIEKKKLAWNTVILASVIKVSFIICVARNLKRSFLQTLASVPATTIKSCYQFALRRVYLFRLPWRLFGYISFIGDHASSAC